MHNYIENTGRTVFHRMGGRATAHISALPVRLAMLSTAITRPCVRSISTSMIQKKHQGLAIALFFAYGHAYAVGAWMRRNVFSYVKQTGKTNLNAAQLRILG